MNLEKAVTYAPFFLGKAVHYGLQQYYENGEVPAEAAVGYMQAELKALVEEHGALWEQELGVLDEQVTLAKGMLDHYHHWTKSESGPFSDGNLRFLALETEFNEPMYTPSGRVSPKFRLGGRFDGVVQKIDDGTYWIFETKTTRSIQELVDTLQNDEQCGTYILAAQQMLGIRISGVLYNILRKKVPTIPSSLQNGYLSQRANLDSTAEAFFAYACWYHGAYATPEQLAEAATNENMNTPHMTEEEVCEYYGPYLEALLAKQDKFFQRQAVFRTPNELKQLSIDLWTVALEMTRKDTPLYPSPTWMNCRFCSFRQPCYAYNAGQDVDFLFEQNYRVRREWDPMEAKEEGESNGQN